MIRTARALGIAAAAVGVGVIGASMVFVAWLATNVRPKH